MLAVRPFSHAPLGGPGVFTVCTLGEVSNKVQGGRAEVRVSVLQHHQSVCIKAADPSVNSPGYEADVSLHVYTLTHTHTRYGHECEGCPDR